MSNLRLIRRVVIVSCLALGGIMATASPAFAVNVVGDCFGGPSGGFCSAGGTDYVCDKVIPGNPGFGYGCSALS